MDLIASVRECKECRAEQVMPFGREMSSYSELKYQLPRESPSTAIASDGIPYQAA
jgi:hypothetical protein